MIGTFVNHFFWLFFQGYSEHRELRAPGAPSAQEELRVVGAKVLVDLLVVFREPVDERADPALSVGFLGGVEEGVDARALPARHDDLPFAAFEMLVCVVERHVGDDARPAGQGAGGGDRVAQHHRRLPRERHRDAVFGKHLDGGAHDGVDEDATVAEAVGGRRGRAEFLHVGSGGAGDVGNRAALALDEVRIIVRRRVAHDDVAALHTGGVERIFERRGLCLRGLCRKDRRRRCSRPRRR